MPLSESLPWVTKEEVRRKHLQKYERRYTGNATSRKHNFPWAMKEGKENINIDKNISEATQVMPQPGSTVFPRQRKKKSDDRRTDQEETLAKL